MASWPYLAGAAPVGRWVEGMADYVSFIVLGQLATVVGALRKWGWTRNRWFRAAHFVAILVVALEAVLGIACPLTVWEDDLRRAAGQDVTGGSFIGRCLDRLIFFQLPPCVFTAVYVGFASGEFLLARTLRGAPPQIGRVPPEAVFLVQSRPAGEGAIPGRFRFLDRQLTVLSDEVRPDYLYDPQLGEEPYQSHVSVPLLLGPERRLIGVLNCHKRESKILRLWTDRVVVTRFKPTVYSFTMNRSGLAPGTDLSRLRFTATLFRRLATLPPVQADQAHRRAQFEGPRPLAAGHFEGLAEGDLGRAPGGGLVFRPDEQGLPPQAE